MRTSRRSAVVLVTSTALALLTLFSGPISGASSAGPAQSPTKTTITVRRTSAARRRRIADACPRFATPSGYVKQENQKLGTDHWKLGAHPGRSHLQAYADRVSVHCGQTVRVYISTRAHHARLIAYRMGYYHGAGGRAVLTTRRFRTHPQSAAVVDPATNTARAPWKVSTSIKIDRRFVPGSYLFKIVDARGGQTYVPLTVTAPGSRAPLALMSEPMTWQAYNGWGGASAYYGVGHNPATRARVVSFDRPYDHNYGSATYFADEYPLVYAMEKAGLDIDYVTDVDINRNPGLFLRHKGVLIGSHPEYWSLAMRDGFETTRDAGVNLAFLGANTDYWQVRLSRSPLGPDRSMAIYKSATEDPTAATSPETATVRWRDAPVNRPESSLIGQEYECFGVNADMVLSTPAWPFTVPAGTRLKDVVLGEYDRVGLGPEPAGLQILATSPLTCKDIPRIATVTYYTAQSGAGVFSAGTMGWVCGMNGSCTKLHPVSTARARRVLTSTTVRLARAMAAGPLGRTHPSHASVLPPPPASVSSLAGDADAGDDYESTVDGSVPCAPFALAAWPQMAGLAAP